ncbi:MAG: 2-hydroxyacid dehydrogenase [Hyphomicrobiales bacterium]|nr:2-hydroxyacid dehydrogenase [Hyphomicrobiales bacterium]
MDAQIKKQVLLIAPVPGDLREALQAEYELIDDPRLEGEGRCRAQVVLTTSIGGASKERLARLPAARLLVCHGAGLDRIDLDFAKEQGVTVRNTPGVVTDDTADMAIALIYAVARNVVAADAFVRAGKWATSRPASSRRVVGKRAGIVGLGRIGRAIGDRLNGAGLHVAYTGPREKADAPYRFAPSVEVLAGQSDFLVLSCPGGEETRGMVDAGVLRALGSDGILVNVSRGSVVDEEALIEALQAGTIAGAGLDVFANEPEPDARFLDLANVVLQPHAASITRETRHAMISMIMGEIADYWRA